MSNLCWCRRDLRLHDHAALAASLEDGPTTVAFIFDSHILEKLQDRDDRRITFIMQSLQEMETKLNQHGSSLVVRYGKPEEEIPKLVDELKIKKVFTNRDYEPYAKKRDDQVARKLKASGVEFHTFKDSVIFETKEVLKGDGSVYKVFTPYKNRWLEVLSQSGGVVPEFKPNLKNLKAFKNTKSVLAHDWYQEIGFKMNAPLLSGGTEASLKRLQKFLGVIADYKEARDIPSVDGTSLLSANLRFGNISIRDLVRAAQKHDNLGGQTWLSELVWRDFYQMLLDAFPRVEHASFKSEYDQIKWLGTEADFEAWCRGETGVPIVDAAMRCLNQTGIMHNRLRMIVASYLCKILLVNWQKGEKYFARHLLDFDLAANNGGWQWSSSSGCDSQPYFRIFNPYTQSTNFDPEGAFIREWVPELGQASAKEIHRPDVLRFPDYLAPVVSYEKNRERCLLMYSAALRKE